MTHAECCGTRDHRGGDLPVLDGGPARLSAAEPDHGRWWRDARRRRLLASADLLAGLVATAIVLVPSTESPWPPLILVPLWPLVAKLFGLYDRDHRALRHLTSDEVPLLLAWAATMCGLVALLLPLTPAEGLDGPEILELFIVSALAATGLRSFARWYWWTRTPPERVRLIGDPPVLESLRRKVGIFREMHLELTGERRIDSLDRSDVSAELNSLAVGVDRIVVAANGAEAELVGALKEICRRKQVKLSVVSPFRGPALPSDRMAQLADLPILEYNTWDASRSTLVIKRAFDLLIASAGLLVFAPFFVVIAILIKLDSSGSVFFSQIRAGLDGRPFRMYKLRTMVDDAEARLSDLVDIDQLDDPVFKLRDDPRVTRTGRILRRFSLDEVPQLFNVLVGEMSMVGPRPEQVELVERYTDEERAKLGVKPGVTGPMQVFGRGELTFPERIAMELEYVENQSLARDLRILIHTPPAVARGTGAF